jgi:transcriptional regulator with XRE-family HTH domain
VKLGDVIRKEREKHGLAPSDLAREVGLEPDAFAAIERGESPLEQWAPHWAQLAIQLELPMSRLVAESGRAEDARAGELGKRVRAAREARGLSPEQLATAAEIPPAEYTRIEAGDSPLEEWAPRLLRCAQVIDEPVFNFLYPCALPFQTLDDYP